MKRILLTLLRFALLTPAFAASVEDLEYETKGDGTSTITDCNDDASGHLVIPATIDGIKVTEIGWGAFEDCSRLTSVTIPEGVTEIEEGALEDCEKLASVVIPEGVTKIGKDAFTGCAAIEEIIFKGPPPSIGENHFQPQSATTTLNMPKLGKRFSVEKRVSGPISKCDLSLKRG